MTTNRSRLDFKQSLPKTITVTVPLRFERRGGRKVVISPVPYTPPPPRHDNALIKALARAYRWRRLIERGEYPSITELAKAEKINQSYACRLLRLTLLAPVIVESILDGTQPKGLQLDRILRPLPVDWQKQVSMVLEEPR
jgi:hypothetical protein